MKEPYIGRTHLVSGEIAEDLTKYFFYSEQQPSSVALGVKIGVEGNVVAAGGMIIQVLPDAAEECLDYLERIIAGMPNYSCEFIKVCAFAPDEALSSRWV